MKKVCIVTASRSEYGPLKWLMDEVANDSLLKLQLVVTGAHLSPEFGLTYQEIEKDGFRIDEKVDLAFSSSSLEGIVDAMGNCSIGFAKTFSRLKPDIIVVLGDRYELLPICGAALIMGIPIAHISGGDITEGAIDDQIRNAVTMMASFHFPGTKESAKRIKRMIGSSKNIYCVGEPGLDNFKRLKLWNRSELAESLFLDSSKKWALMTYLPETKIGLDENLYAIKNLIDALDKNDDIQVIITGANADFGGMQINEFLINAAAVNSSKFKYYISLGQLRYTSLMKEVDFVIGNSSSGIIEAPFFGKPVINIGDRQKGRYSSQNVFNCSNDVISITHAIEKIRHIKVISDNYYGDGNSSIRIKNALIKIMADN